MVGTLVRERSLMMSDIKQVGVSKIAPKMGRYRVGQGGRQVKNGQKTWDVMVTMVFLKKQIFEHRQTL